MIKGGMLRAAFAQRRPTRDLDVHAQQLDGDVDTVRDLVAGVAALDVDDGLDFDSSGAAAQVIRGLRAADRQLDLWQRDAIARARHQGASWSEIGEALGVTKQAAWKLYNEDVREMLGEVRQRSGLSDDEAQRLADAQRDAHAAR